MLNIHRGTGVKRVGEYDGMNVHMYTHTYIYIIHLQMFDAKVVIHYS